MRCSFRSHPLGWCTPSRIKKNRLNFHLNLITNGGDSPLIWRFSAVMLFAATQAFQSQKTNSIFQHLYMAFVSMSQIFTFAMLPLTKTILIFAVISSITFVMETETKVLKKLTSSLLIWKVKANVFFFLSSLSRYFAYNDIKIYGRLSDSMFRWNKFRIVSSLVTKSHYERLW